MRIIDLEIDGFGVWSGLSLCDLAEQVNVFYGPNEAGKTTLLHFIRSMLYGHSRERRDKYLPPVHGGVGGGSMRIATSHGEYLLRRQDTGPHAHGLEVISSDGKNHGESTLTALLGGVDEATFVNVFALGLRDMQELGSLEDTAAAELLYNLSSGLGRATLLDVMRKLAASREELLARDSVDSPIQRLLTRRDRLRVEIDELRSSSNGYTRLAHDRDQTQSRIEALESQIAELERQVKHLELAVQVRESWQARRGLDMELAPLAGLERLPEGIPARISANRSRIENRAAQLKKLHQARVALRDEARALQVNHALLRQTPRLEILLEQEPWIGTLESQVRQLEHELEGSESERSEQYESMGLRKKRHERAHAISPKRSWSELRPLANALREPHRQFSAAEEQAKRSKAAADALAAEIRSALAGRGNVDLVPAIEQAGNVVSQLRYRVQIEERLGQMKRHEEELASQTNHLMDEQLLPGWTLAGLGGLFVFGVVLILAGLLMETSVTGATGWVLAVLGLGGAGLAAIAKVTLERTAAEQLATCQKQANVLSQQVRQANQERDALDAQLPRGGGPLLTRLQAAEQDLSALEGLLTLDSRRQAAQHEADSAQARVAQARDAVRAARRRWKQALTSSGIPPELAPKQVRELSGQWDQIEGLHTRLDRQRQELEGKRRELTALESRVAQSLADAGLQPTTERLVPRLRQIRQELQDQQSKRKRREMLAQRSKKLRKQYAKLEQHLRRLRVVRDRLFRRAGALDEQDFQRRLAAQNQADSLRARREVLSKEIAATLGTTSEEVVRPFLDQGHANTLETRWDEMTARIQASQRELATSMEARGAIQQQLRTLCADRRLSEKMFDLGQVETQLSTMIERWQVLTATGSVLESVRKSYETDRQPETLREASAYLERFTEGRYRRIWTPFSDRALRVDDGDGKTLPVDVLSRGTREQLFLSLRLALCANFSRRGVHLPMILDDVLVNFDVHRAKAAAIVLREFAEQGHQMLVFTCHEHVFKIFKSLGVQAHALPDRYGGVVEPDELELTHAAKEVVVEPRLEVAEPPEDDINDEIGIANVELHVSADLDAEDKTYNVVPWDENLEQPAASLDHEEPLPVAKRRNGESTGKRRRKSKDRGARKARQEAAHETLRARPRGPFDDTFWHEEVVDDQDQGQESDVARRATSKRSGAADLGASGIGRAIGWRESAAKSLANGANGDSHAHANGHGEQYDHDAEQEDAEVA